MRYPFFQAAAAMLCGALALPCAAQVYKWVDEHGVTHYDATPPPGSNAKVQTLAIPVAPEANPASSQSWQEKDNEFRSRYDKRKAEEAKAEEKQDKSMAQRKNACINAQNRLAIYERAGRIYHMDENGNRIYLSDQERDQQLAGIQQSVAANCSG